MFSSPIRIAIVMGVSGSGKTTIARLLAQTLGWQFLEGDDRHSTDNRAKMRAGVALGDDDRMPWLHAIRDEIDGWRQAGQSGVVACSALKRAYRAVLIGESTDVALIYLRGVFPLIRRRLAERQGHFMPIGLLESQFANLEEPAADERPITLDVMLRPERIVTEILNRLELPGRSLSGRVPA